MTKTIMHHVIRIILVPTFLGTIFGADAKAQSDWTCIQIEEGEEDPNRDLASCGSIFDYIPDDYTYKQAVKMNFHFMLDGNGGGNFTATGDNNGTSFTGQDYVDILVAQANTHLQVNWQMNLPPGNSTPSLPMNYTISKKQVYFWNDANFFDWADFACCMGTVMNTFGQNVDSEINVFFISDNVYGPGPVSNAGFAITSGQTRYVVLKGAWQNYAFGNNGFTNAYQQARLLIHEMGHALSLRHTMLQENGQACDPDKNDDCSDTPNQDELAALGMSAPFGCCGSGPNCTNNMMDYNADWALSPQQLGKIHRELSSVLFDFTEPTYCTMAGPPKVVPTGSDITWNGTKILGTDLIVENGATLTIKCLVHLPAGARIIVEPNGKLIVDGGHITNLCNEQWGGIEVWGTSNQHQYPINNPTHQGLVVLTNGAVIEHAREAIRLWKPQDWNSMGGVVQVKGTSGNPGALFLNCRRSVEFMAYQNYQPGNPSLLRPNFSSFTYADFKVDDDYRGGHDFEAHVTMWGVDGVVFRACNFENAQTTGPNSLQLGEGIFSLDANYSVGANCTVALPYGVPCPPENLERGTVKGLGHGIDARNSGSGRGFAAGSLDLENNVVGIYTEGLTGFSAIKNNFVLGNRDVEMVGEVDYNFQEHHHRGISSQLSFGFRIEENDFVRANEVLAEGVDGIVIENSGPHSTEVYANTARDLDNGYIGEGNCIDGFSASSVGHQFLCNQNLGNGQNFWVRNDDGNTSFHSIRTQQGSKDIPAGNTFDQLSDERDYKNETSWVINYWHSGGNEEPIYVTPGWLVTTQTNDASGCPSRSEGRELRLTPELTSEVRNDFDLAKEAYISTAYVYKSLLDGGNTQAVVDEVQESWPQEAWDLRNYLMSKSPYLSTTVLMEVVKKNILPQAMVLEICLANPEATKKESFIKWAEYEAPNPLPGYMIDLIAGSWDERTFRMELEAQMGQHHADMSVAADILQASYRADEETIPLADMLDQWNKMPNYGARFAEVEMHLRMKQFEQAKAILNSLAARYTLKEEREAERDRAIWYIDRLQGLTGEGRSIMQFNATEVAELTTFAETASDIPGTWVRNILCFGYQICLPHGEGGGGGNKALKPRKDVPNSTSDRVLEVMPNPASAWATIEYDLGMETSEAYVRIIDARGKEVALLPAMAAKGQLLWDTRTVPSGVYAIELFRAKERVSTRRLVVQPAP